MKIRTIMVVSSAISLIACGASLLWTSVIDGATLTGAALPVATQGNNVYQLFPIGNQLQLRKLSSAGAVQWQTAVDDSIANSLSAPKLRATESGVVVGYNDSANKQAYVKSFDIDGGLLWQSGLGTHNLEILEDLATTGDNGIVAAVRLTNTVSNVLKLDSSGSIQWETPIPACFIACLTTVGVDAQGDTLVNNTELLATKSYLLDSSGTQVWYRRRATGTSLNLAANKITPTATGFAILHPFVSWHYDLAGTETWSYASGSGANIVTDETGNFYIPGVGKISKLDATGTLISEIDMSDQASIRQLQWRRDLQRLIALTTYESVGPELDGTITADSGMTLSIYDATAVRKARYVSKASLVKSSLCTPYPQCTNISLIPGETWSQFATTTDKKLVVSGIISESQRFAKAFKLP